MTIRKWLCLALVVCAGGCSLNQSRTTQLQRVAKDWCLTIRASQVLPAYPLTEDLQVGDIFLVSTPIGEETKIFNAKGFLPLDNGIARLYPTGYADYYKDAYGIAGDNIVVPHQWQFPNPARTTSPSTDWGVAPGAAFPSYTFQVKKGAGASLALPINAVPVGLSLLRTGDANGSVNISSASTYALPIAALNDQVDDWADGNRAFLSIYAPQGEKKNYVRVVQRVYVAGAVNVSLANASSTSARADAGAAPASTLLPAGSNTNTLANAANDYENALNTLNKSIASATPGGSLEIASASSRSISLNETFPRPLVFGYLAFDREILAGGELGPPLPTHARMTGQKLNEPVMFDTSDANKQTIRDWLKTEGNSAKLNTWLEVHSLNPKNRAAYINGTKYRSLRQQIVDEVVK